MTLQRGAWKEDLWSLCKLYINSSINSDIDIEYTIHLYNTIYPSLL